MFLPAIPAYLWLWPKVEGDNAWILQSLSYLYVVVGTVIIGRRRWSWSQLGLNRNGIWFSLGCGAALLLGRLLIILSIDWVVPSPQLSLTKAAVDILYYFCLVGLVEELLYRGLIYRALEDWRGIRWAIWGSSFGFVLWHIFGQGILVGLAGLILGLIFALIRWRAGGIIGLIMVHALIDLETTFLVADSNPEVLGGGRPDIVYPVLMFLGLGLLVLLPIYLWKLYPFIGRFWRAGTFYKN